MRIDGCGQPCKRFEVHHIREEAYRQREGQRVPLAAKDGLLVCLPCHKALTAAGAPLIAKAKRVARKHVGAIVPTGTIPNRPFPKWEKPRKPSRPVVPRREIFKEG